MTVLVAARCSDGIVVGADSISTSTAGPHSLIQIKSDDKIKIIGDRIIMAGTGSVGLGQRFKEVVQTAWNAQVFSKSCNDCCKHISNAAVNDFHSTGARHPQTGAFGFGAIMAAPISDKCELIEFALGDLQPERKTSRIHFVSMGSGQILADPFLAFVSRVLWKDSEPSVKIATFGVYWVLNHAITIAPGGVGHPIQMATLRRESGKWKARLLPEQEMGELSQHIAEIEGQIGNYPSQTLASAVSSTPPALKP